MENRGNCRDLGVGGYDKHPWDRITELHGGRSKTKVPTVGDIYGYFYFGTTHSAYKTKKHVDR